MARMQSEKRHLSGYAKPSNSTLETSGVASTERLATGLGRSFDGSLRGTPATITSEVADTGVGSGVEEHREQPQVPSPQGVEQATATSTDRGVQDDQEEFRAASPKDVCDL
ncbi:hypothetical protein PISMIDRAFT_689444 [Pisolithus microcarpus 441]|uniref:Uncharacterized protein n=1 Tax=Pisolithus microcarpus 441 TaxID=765257 RepID=A0A0C9YX98_9AGAM|nr:hypothetical protein BKA83DRAFT_689444 [Pisolithus microcarpus]KIK12493.1 hypothetical protein PISMIDRAFT_689444 [Pisolithus microcarpus 441]